MIMRQREQLMRVDGVVLAVTLALSMATGLAVGAAAGWRSSRAAVRHAGDAAAPCSRAAAVPAIGVLACYVPARRAALVDPVTVLRSE